MILEKMIHKLFRLLLCQVIFAPYFSDPLLVPELLHDENKIVNLRDSVDKELFIFGYCHDNIS